MATIDIYVYSIIIEYKGENTMHNKAFTLAEVLITLTIIGVIAATTIPNLMHKHQEQEMVVKLKKEYSVFANAYKMAIAENGPVDDWDIGTSIGSDASIKLYNYFKPYLKIEKTCGVSSGCMFSGIYKSLFGEKVYDGKPDTRNNYAKGLLKDGTSFYLYSGARTYSNGILGSLGLDLNGKKGPNRAGVDYVELSVTPTGIKPRKVIGECVFNGTNQSNGLGCSAWLFYKGNMDYLRRDISTEYAQLNN